MKCVASLAAVLALSFALTSPPASFAAVRTEWFASPAGTGTTCKQASPCSLQQAAVKAVAGGTVYLATGTYTALPLTTEVLSVTKSLTFMGGWDATLAYPPVRSENVLSTTLDGQNAVRGVKIKGKGVSVTLDGLTLYRGLSTDRGGGAWVSKASLTLLRVAVIDNHVTATAANNLDFGGGGVCIAGGRFTAISSYFINNGALNTNGYYTYGGGVLLKDAAKAVVEGTFFFGNDARFGSGIGMRSLNALAAPTPVIVSECTFASNGLGNSGSGLGDYGGGVSLERAAAKISDSSFSKNAVTKAGAAVYHHYGNLNMDRNTVTENSAGTLGIILIFDGNGRLRNNIIADNSPGSESETAAVYLVRPSVEVTFIHNTIVGPATGHRGSGVAAVNDASAVMVNNILARLDEGAYAWQGGVISLEGTLWGTSPWANALNFNTDGLSTITPLSGNVSGDPAFLVPAIAGPRRLGPTSAARNKAVPSTLTVDVDGEPRGSRPDIGADEYMTEMLLLAPNGGQSLAEGSSYEVRWGAPITAETFKLSYSLDGGATWKLIAGGRTGRSYTWQLPEVGAARADCLVRVIGYEHSGAVFGSDLSDAVFTIRDLN